MTATQGVAGMAGTLSSAARSRFRETIWRLHDVGRGGGSDTTHAAAGPALADPHEGASGAARDRKSPSTGAQGLTRCPRILLIGVVG